MPTASHEKVGLSELVEERGANMTTYHKITVELDNHDFELLRSLCRYNDMPIDTIISEALTDSGLKENMFVDEFLSEFYGEPIHRVKSIGEILLNLYLEKEKGKSSP